MLVKEIIEDVCWYFIKLLGLFEEFVWIGINLCYLLGMKSKYDIYILFWVDGV